MEVNCGRTVCIFASGYGGCVLYAFATNPARAITILHDPDIENALRQLSMPLITAVGLGQEQIGLLVVRDSSLNALVFDTEHILIHSGLILSMESANELRAVIAHEFAHIAHGHIPRRISNLRTASGATRIGLFLALATGADTAAGIAAGPIGKCPQGVFLRHTRSEEASADQSALRYLSRAGVDPDSMANLLKRFLVQEVLSVARQYPYVRTHPPTKDRIRAVKGFAATYGGDARPSAQADLWLARAKAKPGAFIQPPNHTPRLVARDDRSDIAVMRRAIAYHRLPDRSRALVEIETPTSGLPDDPYIHELRVQFLLESGETAAAVRAYARAENLNPDEPLILAGHGRALLALNTTGGHPRALRKLELAYSRDGQDPRLLRDLAVAYPRNGQRGMASVAMVERYALTGALRSAGLRAARAVDLLPTAAGWIRAQDVLTAVKSAG